MGEVRTPEVCHAAPRSAPEVWFLKPLGGPGLRLRGRPPAPGWPVALCQEPPGLLPSSGARLELRCPSRVAPRAPVWPWACLHGARSVSPLGRPRSVQLRLSSLSSLPTFCVASWFWWKFLHRGQKAELGPCISRTASLRENMPRWKRGSGVLARSWFPADTAGSERLCS